jgi:predicted acetyltransferase
VIVGPARGDADWEQFTTIGGQAFATTREKTEQYIAAVRDGAIARFAIEEDGVVAGALAFPCHQLVGGRPVTAGAIASVCVAPERRGRGLGRQVVDGLVAAMREEGLALAPLWPSSVAFYRGLGWEIAGHVGQFNVPAVALRGRAESGIAVRDPDLAEVGELRLPITAAWTGPLIRPGWWWGWRLPHPVPELHYRYGWREGDRLTGFVAYRHDPPAGRPWGFDTWVTDFWAATPSSFTGLLDLLAADAPLSPTIRFGFGVLPDMPPLVWRLPDLDLKTADTNGWMLRVLDPAAAFVHSGWPAAAAGTLTLEIGGAAPLTVEFADGAAEVTPGGGRPATLSEGTFAAWLTGALRAGDAARMGLLAGSPDAVALMEALTADRRPWLPDMF